MRALDQLFFRDPSYRFHKAVMLEHLLSTRIREWLSLLLGLVVVLYAVVFFWLAAASHFSTVSPVVFRSTASLMNETHILVNSLLLNNQEGMPSLIPFVATPKVPIDTSSPIGGGFFLVALFGWFVLKMLRFYQHSYYYHAEGLLERGQTGIQTAYTTPNYEVCDIYYCQKYGDLLQSFVTSSYGRIIFHRLGIADKSMDVYLKNRTTVVNYNDRIGELREVFTLVQLAHVLIEVDPDFYQFLFQLGVRDRELAGATEWVERQLKDKKQHDRFWGRVALGKIPSIGSEFAYGAAYSLSRFARDLSKQTLGGASSFHFIYGNEQIKQLEVILSRSKEANALLIGEDGSGKMEVILDFARDIRNGYTNPALVNKRVMAFDASGFVASMHTKQEFESMLLAIMSDAVNAGNVILVIDDLPGFVIGAHALDVDVMALIDPYLSGSVLQVIATADNSRFHQLLEPSNAIMQRFEKVMLTEPPEASLIRIVEAVALREERRNPIFFTYQSIVEIIRSAEHYFSEGVMPDKAIDLIVEIIPSMLSRGGHLVKKMDVLEFVKHKTNIPVGEISNDERERLQNLEVMMKKLVVGQKEAIEVIANAMRRSRAGVRNMDRPIGSFLFLGPTGVGKTETAKALAAVFFGNEGAMSRIDMSEYQGDDGLSRMVGTMDGIQGSLPILLKEHPYGVVLLDEFEKANSKVHDLFLQVLDEGIFHDAEGKKVNARNAIFIATSNAGASEIRDAVHAGIDLESAKKTIIDGVISAGKLKPELFNRFDGIILFHPLSREDYQLIAEIMLKKLQKRLRERSINLVINDTLREAVLHSGIDPDMGARPMARAVQNIVEQKVAEKIISGVASEGATITFTREDFPELLA